MSIATISEKIHHGNYRNTRVGVLEFLDVTSLKEFLDRGPYAAGGYSRDRVSKILDELMEGGKAEHGWARFQLELVPDEPFCEYYVSCDNTAVGVVAVGVIDHAVPVCQRCADKHNLEVVKFLPGMVKYEPRKLGDYFTIRTAENGDHLHLDTVEPGDVHHAWAIREVESTCDHVQIEDGCDDCTPDFEALPGFSMHPINILYYVLTEQEWTAADKDVKYVY